MRNGLPIGCIMLHHLDEKLAEVSGAREQPLLVAGGKGGARARWGVGVVT